MICVGVEVDDIFAGFPVNQIPMVKNELCPKVRIGQDDLPGE